MKTTKGVEIVVTHQHLAVLPPPDSISTNSRRKPSFVHDVILFGRKDNYYWCTNMHSCNHFIPVLIKLVVFIRAPQRAKRASS